MYACNLDFLCSYMKGGKLSKAVEMCFNAKLFDVLQHITDDLGPTAHSDPGLYMRCSEFFMSVGGKVEVVELIQAVGAVGSHCAV